MSVHRGQCLCGAVKFEAAELGGFGICHCTQCQKWVGGPLFGVTVKEGGMTLIEGADKVRSYRTSAWASRCRCADCGSPLWYRFDKGEDGKGNYEVPLGLLDDANGLVLRREIFVDQKPDSFDIAGDHPRLTKAETMAAFSGGSA